MNVNIFQREENIKTGNEIWINRYSHEYVNTKSAVATAAAADNTIDFILSIVRKPSICLHQNVVCCGKFFLSLIRRSVE